MAKSLYIGNLPFSATEGDLRTMFAQFGAVTRVNMITDRETGRPRGFAFVEIEGDVDGIIRALDGYRMSGRVLKVNEAKPREPRAPRETSDYRDSREYRPRQPRW
ncbi:RNA-binding protein [Desulfocurvibacter africanus]|uniref:RNP-1 like RNA-binding protein n=1 Tax=Desulfocurvibacter africanus subsp. africanus str. Walvis Bay TaxID=690850 RepID=F3YX68_DESAF|nr:RNA-binding protein [Desulfocurvibacter africanus]EGJ49456.1 RNP-1 like RNA-binding protein [Desulfocurvibacter africanus subsp. africanus str. Walvis Bay]